MLKKIIFITFIFSNICVAQNIRGVVTDALNSKPLRGANITLLGTDFRTESDSNGVFRFTNLTSKIYVAEVSFLGYARTIVKDIEVVKGSDAVANITLQVAENQLNTVVVNGERNDVFHALQTQYPLSVAQTLRFPAAFNDPARLAMNSPGVRNDNDLGNGLSIHGYAPAAMQWRLEGVEILNPNHLANASSFNDQATASSGGVNALSSQMLGTSALVTGAYSSEYNNLISGCMDMRLRNGNDEKHRFTTQIGLVGLDLAAEGPLSKKSKSSYLVNYRYSTVGLLLQMGIPLSEEKVNFQDLAWNFHFPIGKKSDLKVFGMLGNSRNTFETKKDTIRNDRDLTNVYFKDRLQVYGANFKSQLNSKTSFYLSAAYSSTAPSLVRQTFDENFKFVTSEFKTNSSQNLWSVNTFIQHKLNNIFSIKYGASVAYSAFGKGYSGTSNIYTDLKYQKRNHSLLVGISLFRSTISGPILISQRYTITHFLPKISYAYRVSDDKKIVLSASRQSKFDIVSNQLTLNFDKKSENQHFSAGLFFHNILPKKYSTTITAYRNLAFIAIPEMFNFYLSYYEQNNYGIEAQYEKTFARNIFFNANGSLFRALLKTQQNTFRSNYFGANYTTNLSLGKEWTKKANKIWGASTHIISNGANYLSPTDVNADNLLNQIIITDNRGAANFSFKPQNYFRTDLRLYYKRDRKTWSSTLSLDIQNVTNQKNIAFEYYDTFLKKINTKYQNGLIPILAWRANF